MVKEVVAVYRWVWERTVHDLKLWQCYCILRQPWISWPRTCLNGLHLRRGEVNGLKLSHSSVVNIVGDKGIANLGSDKVTSKLQVTCFLGHTYQHFCWEYQYLWMWLLFMLFLSICTKLVRRGDVYIHCTLPRKSCRNLAICRWWLWIVAESVRSSFLVIATVRQAFQTLQRFC